MARDRRRYDRGNGLGGTTPQHWRPWPPAISETLPARHRAPRRVYRWSL